jgi:hypothetical protein
VGDSSGKPARKTPRAPAVAPAMRKAKSAKLEPPQAAPSQPAPPVEPPASSDVSLRLDAAVKRHFALVDRRDTSQAGKQAVALAHAEVWRLRADQHHHEGFPDAARKASSSANELEQLAAKLERDSLADRVAELERRLSATRKAAAGLADLDD